MKKEVILTAIMFLLLFSSMLLFGWAMANLITYGV